MSQPKIRRYLKHGTLPQLRAFEACVRLGSGTRAAEELHMAQPTASVLLKKLCETVGVPLFEPIGRRLQLTEAGERVHAHPAQSHGGQESRRQHRHPGGHAHRERGRDGHRAPGDLHAQPPAGSPHDGSHRLAEAEDGEDRHDRQRPVPGELVLGGDEAHPKTRDPTPQRSGGGAGKESAGDAGREGEAGGDGGHGARPARRRDASRTGSRSGRSPGS